MSIDALTTVVFTGAAAASIAGVAHISRLVSSETRASGESPFDGKVEAAKGFRAGLMIAPPPVIENALSEGLLGHFPASNERGRRMSPSVRLGAYGPISTSPELLRRG